MKIVITGGTGFIGQGIARALLKRGTVTGPSGGQEKIDSIVLFDIAVPDAPLTGMDDRVSVVAGDISDRETVFKLIDRDDISVFHLASVVSAGGEKDFDLAMRINLDGGRHVLEAARARASCPRVVFASSLAVFGGKATPKTISDTTKQTPQTTYGMTKSIGELMINDYTRKGFINGRSARLPTIIIRPGKPNAAASSFCSGVFREPLNGETCTLPVSRDTRMAMLGSRNVVAGFISLHEADGDKLGEDRAINLPSRTYSVADMIEASQRVAHSRGINIGPVQDAPDAAIEAIVAGWPAEMVSERALALGLPLDDSLDQVVEDFIDDWMQ